MNDAPPRALSEREPATNTWWPARRRFAAMAVVTATLTGVGGALLAGSGWQDRLAAVYVLLAVVALFSPAAIAVQVIAGQVLLGSLLVAREGLAPSFLLPVVAGVVVTAELLATVARLDAPVEGDSRKDLRRAGLAAVVGCSAYSVVALVGGVRGPTGVVAVTLASAACVVLAGTLVGKASRWTGAGP
jgi:hypothetical protein